MKWFVEISTKENPLATIDRFPTKKAAMEEALKIFYTKKYTPSWSRIERDVSSILRAVYVTDELGYVRCEYRI